jgi:tetratricopeptide (TPR) repeat protein
MRIILFYIILFISIFFIIDNYSKSNLFLYHSDSLVSILKSAFAEVVDNKNNHTYNNSNNTKIIDNIVTKSRQLFYLGDYQGAIKIIDNMLPVVANNSAAMNIKGTALDHLGKPQEAIVWLDKALAIDKNNTKAMDNKGTALDDLGKPQEAIVWYDKMLAIDKNDTVMHCKFF